MQIVNLLAWLIPNAYLVYLPCRWNGSNWIVTITTAVIRWTCWCVLASCGHQVHRLAARANTRQRCCTEAFPSA